MASGSSPPRPAFLPKELHDLEERDRWGEEHPTVVYPSAAAISDEPEPSMDRPTEIPEVPGDEFARRLMAAAGDSHEPFLREKLLPDGIPSAILDREAETHRPRRPPEPSLRSPFSDPFADPFSARAEGAKRPSAYPTAPPSLPNSRKPASIELAGDAPPAPGAESRGWNGQALEATLRPPRSLTPRSYAAQSFEFPTFASAPPAHAVPLSDMKDRFAMGDFSGALHIAESILARDPEHRDARSVATKCQEVLLDMYGSRLPNLDEPPRLVMAPAQLRWLTLDHRAGFLLSMVDGISTVEEILDISGMPRIEAMRILCELVDKRIIVVGN